MGGQGGGGGRTAASGASAGDLVTVVIPTYNRADDTRRAVDSALAQTYSRVEVVVVDDCSDDGTADRMAGLYGDRITLIRRASNGGGGAARNTGIRAARGRWVRCLDSDDEMAPSAVAEFVAAAAARRDDPERCLFFSDCWVVYDNDTRRFPAASSAYNGSGAAEAAANAVWGTGLLFAARSAFERHGYFREDLRYSEDLEWILRMLLLHGFAFHTVDRLLLNYRQHEGSTTGTAPEAVESTKEQVLGEMAARLGPVEGGRLLREFRRVDEQRAAQPGPIGRAWRFADAVVKCKMPRLYMRYHGIRDGFAR